MEVLIFLDTHIVAWLYSGNLELFNKVAIEEIRKCDLLISPIVKLELSCLHEAKRIDDPSDVIIDDLGKRINLKVADDGFLSIIDIASGYNWTRDPFDRIITAHAEMRSLRLLTKDRKILANYDKAFWR
jgi:PIN domain nuclease of toxin-antitoxin system